jgi:hypothetical protein
MRDFSLEEFARCENFSRQENIWPPRPGPATGLFQREIGSAAEIIFKKTAACRIIRHVHTKNGIKLTLAAAKSVDGPWGDFH